MINRNFASSVALALLSVVVVIIFIRVSSVSNESKRMKVALIQLRDSLGSAHRSLDSLRAQRPGLGEYMSTIQLHVAKLWFAGQSSNWKLAKYELDELGETIEGAEALHAKKDSVDVSAVLRSIRETQLPLLDQ